MKKLMAVLLALGMFGSAWVIAWEEYYEKETPKAMEDREVIYYDFDLEVEVEWGKIHAQWDEFDGEWFDWFKLVYSTTHSEPVYPDDKVMFIGRKDQLEASFKPQDDSTHYVRICAVVLNDDYSKDRYCSKVQKLVTSDEDFETKREEYYHDKKEETKKHKEEKKEYTKKVEEKKEYVKKEVKTSILSSAMKTRIDWIIENFIEKLEDKWYSDSEMTAAINTVIKRLAEFKYKEGYKDIVRYMIMVLEEYRDDYSNPLQDLESIFDGL
jgi:hypothetical protein